MPPTSSLVVLALACSWLAPPATASTDAPNVVGGCQLFPKLSAFNQPVDTLPVLAYSDELVAVITSAGANLFPDFGATWDDTYDGDPNVRPSARTATRAKLTTASRRRSASPSTWCPPRSRWCGSRWTAPRGGCRSRTGSCPTPTTRCTRSPRTRSSRTRPRTKAATRTCSSCRRGRACCTRCGRATTRTPTGGPRPTAPSST